MMKGLVKNRNKHVQSIFLFIFVSLKCFFSPRSNLFLHPLENSISLFYQVKVEQWQTVGQRMALIFQDPDLWCESTPTTPLASPSHFQTQPRVEMKR